MRENLPAKWKGGLIFATVAIVLMSAVATFDLTVLAPKRLEKERQARRDAPPKLMRPSLRLDTAPQREILTAFRIEEWRNPEPPPPQEPSVGGVDPADIYLHGYMAIREAEELLEKGKPAAARAKYELAAKAFNAISNREPNYQPAMVQFRRKKIAEALAKIPAVPDGGDKKPQSNLNGRQSGAVDSPEEVQFASQPSSGGGVLATIAR